MKKTIKSIIAVLILLTLSLSLVACGGNSGNKKTIPYTNAEWGITESEIKELEGESCDDSYAANTGGTCYVFNGKSYLDYSGSIRYFTDESGKLVQTQFVIDFSDSTDSNGNLLDEYQKLIDDYTKKYGDADYNSDESQVKSKVWYTDKANVGVMCVDFIQHQIQITYHTPTEQNN